MLKQNLILACFVVTAAFSGTACTQNDKANQNQGARALEMQESDTVELSDVTDWKSAEAYALQEGYYDGKLCQTYLKGGEKVYYSASYDNGEAGQAFGELQADGGKHWFVQEGMQTTQAMFAPGLGEFEGRSLWEFNRYFKLMCSVAFGKGLMGPDYDSVSAAKTNMTGGTAGGSVRYDDALKITLKKSTYGGKTDVTIIFAKGKGPRVMEFSETNMPSGTAKVYID